MEEDIEDDENMDIFGTDETIMEIKKQVIFSTLFKDCTFYLGREVPNVCSLSFFEFVVLLLNSFSFTPLFLSPLSLYAPEFPVPFTLLSSFLSFFLPSSPLSIFLFYVLTS